MIFRRDLCGIFCALLTYLAMIYADYVVIVWLITPTFIQSLWGVLHAVMFNTVLFFAFASHLRAMITDPGIVPISRSGLLHCNRNRFPKSLSGSESNSTDTDVEVIEENKFVVPGLIIASASTTKNISFNFCCMLAYLQDMRSGILIVTAWVYHDEYGMKGPYGQSVHHTKILHTVFLSIESALFGLFVLAVSCDQIQALLNDETAVEAVQRKGFHNRVALSRSKIILVREVCGTGPMILWLLPCSALPSERDVVQLSNQPLIV
uniref:Palmitoyltransferase n=1 Tax=Wuchereria bancrofti TaxID=6293 RepID=A0A1I8ES08_WUCBA